MSTRAQNIQVVCPLHPTEPETSVTWEDKETCTVHIGSQTQGEFIAFLNSNDAHDPSALLPFLIPIYLSQEGAFALLPNTLPTVEIYEEVHHMAYPWIPATYTVRTFIDVAPHLAILGLARALFDHQSRNHQHSILALTFSTAGAGAVASIHYGEVFEPTYTYVQTLAQIDPEWHGSHRGPIETWPSHDLAIRSEFAIERAYVATAALTTTVRHIRGLM